MVCCAKGALLRSSAHLLCTVLCKLVKLLQQHMRRDGKIHERCRFTGVEEGMQLLCTQHATLCGGTGGLCMWTCNDSHS